MFLRFCDRPSDSPYIERVWRGRSDGGGPFVSVAAGHLELVVTRLADVTMVTVGGPETRATIIDCPPDGEWAAIRFRLGVHMPALPTHLLVDHRDVNLAMSADGSFVLQGSRWPLPDLENAERCRCEEALEFYRGAVGADATVFARFEDKVAHAVLRIGDTVVLASDGQGAGQPDFSGFSLSLTVSDDAEAERLFSALSDRGMCRYPWHRRPSRRALAWSPTSSACRGWSCHKMRRGDLPIS